MSKKAQQVKRTYITLSIIVAVGILGVVGFLIWRSYGSTASPAVDFSACKAMHDSRMLETFPEQCVTSDGKQFTGPGTVVMPPNSVGQ